MLGSRSAMRTLPGKEFRLVHGSPKLASYRLKFQRSTTEYLNIANPRNDLNDTSDLGHILNTVGGPRVMQLGLKLKF
jgi:hypothetical protein